MQSKAGNQNYSKTKIRSRPDAVLVFVAAQNLMAVSTRQQANKMKDTLS